MVHLQVPKRMYFGREVGVGNRRVIAQYALPKRVYLGPTSMDTEMAFVMCNQAKVYLSILPCVLWCQGVLFCVGINFTMTRGANLSESPFCCRCAGATLCLTRLLALAAFWWLQRTSARSLSAPTSTSGCSGMARLTPLARCARLSTLMHLMCCASASFFCMRVCE